MKKIITAAVAAAFIATPAWANKAGSHANPLGGYTSAQELYDEIVDDEISTGWHEVETWGDVLVTEIVVEGFNTNPAFNGTWTQNSNGTWSNEGVLTSMTQEMMIDQGFVTEDDFTETGLIASTLYYFNYATWELEDEDGNTIGTPVTGTKAWDYNPDRYSVIINDWVDYAHGDVHAGDFINAHGDGWMGQGVILTGRHHGHFDTFVNLAPMADSYHVNHVSMDKYDNLVGVNVIKDDKAVRVRAQHADEDTYIVAHVAGKHKWASNAIVASGAALVLSKFDTLGVGDVRAIMNNTRNDDGTMNLGRAMSPYGSLQ